MKFTKQTYVDVSTAHITEKDCDLLNKDEYDQPLFCLPFEYGFWLWAHDYKNLHDWYLEYGYSQAICDLMWEASQQEVAWIKLDCDGFDVEGAPKFNW